MLKPDITSNYISKIQILRLVAAGMVLFGHIQHEIVELAIGGAGAYTPFDPFQWGAGVDVFFILSGFIMYYLCHDRFGREGEPAKFLKRRAIRLVPTYWLFTALMVAATLLLGSQLAHTQIDPAHLLASLVFLPWPNPAGEMRPFLLLGWTLNYEVLFYALFALGLTMPKRAGLSLLVAVFFTAATLHPLVPERLWMLRYWSDPIILEFLLGIALARLFVSGRRLSAPAGFAIAAAGFALLAVFYAWGWQDPGLRFVWGGLPAFLICIGVALQHEGRDHSSTYRAAVLGGTASYSLYLSHPFSINAIALVWRKLGLGMPLLFLAVAFTGSIAASIVIYLLVERPVIGLLGRGVAKGPPVPKVAVEPQ